MVKHTQTIRIVCTSSPLSAGGLNLLPNFKKGRGLVGPQFLEGVAGKEGNDFQEEGGGGGGEGRGEIFI